MKKTDTIIMYAMNIILGILFSIAMLYLFARCALWFIDWFVG